jgi:hypothetical protein
VARLTLFYKPVAFIIQVNAILIAQWSIIKLAVIIIKGKGKAIPLQAWSGPEGSRKLRFPDYMTTAQDGGKVVNLTHRPPSPIRKCSWYSFL